MSKFKEDFEEAFLQGVIWLSDIGFILFLIISSPIWLLPYILKLRTIRLEAKKLKELEEK